MPLIRIHEKPNAVPVNASVFVLSTRVNGVWCDQKVTWEQLKGLIGALDNLENYYKKSETYTKTEVNQLIAQIPSFTVEIVQELPTEDISTTTLYLVPKTTAGTLDYYDEFINLDGTTSGWEYVGKTEVDLSNYYTKAETEAYVKGDGADYIAGTKTFSSLTTTAKNILGAINEAAGVASGAQRDATQALADASAAQGTANSASSAASAAQGTADNALTAAGNAASAASAAQGTANTALTTAQSMAVSVTNTLTPGDTTKKVADVTQNSTTTTSIYADDAEKVVVALTDTQTATGNPVTLTTAQEGGAKSALVTFAPKQSGTGDPSPSNIRPISGWDSLSLNDSENLFSDFVQGGINDTTGADVAISTRIRSGYKKCPKSSFTLTLNNAQNSNERIRSVYFYTENNAYISSESIENTSATITTIPSNAEYIRVVLKFVSDPAITPQNETVGVNQLPTHTATFPSTIMGGNYDFVSGKGAGNMSDILTITESTSIGFSTTTNAYYAYITKPSDSKTSGNKDLSVLYCDRFLVSDETTSLDDSGKIGKMLYRTANNRFYFGFAPNTTEEEMKQTLIGTQISYELATPTPITLTPADVNLLKGTNTVWTDGDTVQVKYSELPQGNLGAVIDYIQKLEARVKALEA